MSHPPVAWPQYHDKYAAKHRTNSDWLDSIVRTVAEYSNCATAEHSDKLRDRQTRVRGPIASRCPNAMAHQAPA